MSAEPDFLSVEDVIQIHGEQIAAYGGAAGVRDRGLLESAVATPRASFGEAYLHEDLAPHGRRVRLSHRPESAVF
jgi:death-on-curing protein